MKLPLSLSVIALLAMQTLCHAASEIHGRLQLRGQYNAADNTSLDAYLNEQYRDNAFGDLRLTWQPRRGNWDMIMHYQMTGNIGDDVRYNRKLAPYQGPTPALTWFDWKNDIVNKDNFLLEHKIDRMALGYSASNYVLRIGRQALTWGSGKLFQIMDLVGPFAPNAIDTAYKPGVDMVYAQWLFSDGSDLQFAGAARPKLVGGSISRDASTIALHYRRSFADVGTTWLLSHNYEHWTIGAGLSGPLKGATWNIEIVPVFDVGGTTKISLLSNLDFATTFMQRHTTVFFEYYRNGYGKKNQILSYRSLPEHLLNQLARAQVFNISKNYLGAGFRLEWTPLLSISSNLIANLDDSSVYATIESEYSTSDNSSLLLAAQLSFGSRNTEYGGILLSEQTGVYLKPTNTIYLQYRQYF